MGGILSGLIGGIARGAVGGYTAEGERKRKEEEMGKNLMTKMHMQRLEDWENLSPEERQFHTGALEKIYKMHPGTMDLGVRIGEAVHGHLPQEPVQEPRTSEFGERPIDIPYNVQDLTPATLPKPAIVENAPLRPPPTIQSVYGEMGLPTDVNQRTPAQTKMAQQELFRMNQARTAREEAEQAKESELQRNLGAMKGKVPESEQTAMEQSARFPTYYKGTTGGTFGQPTAYEEIGNPANQFLIGHNSKTNKFYNAETGETMPTLPPNVRPSARPRQFAPRYKEDISGNLFRIDPNTPEGDQSQGKGMAQVPGFKGKPFVPPVANVTYQTPGGLVTVPTPRNEAVAAGRTALKAAGGGTPNVTPEFSNPLTPQGQKALTELLPVKAQFKGLLDDLEDIKDNNQPLTYLGDRGLYAIGRATDAAALISNLELAKITGAMPYAKASRNFQYFQQIQQHLGNVKTDSPKLLYSKLKNAMKNFDEMEKDIRAVDVKGATPSAGLTAPPAGDIVRVRDKRSGKTGNMPRAKLQAALASGNFEQIK